MKISSGSDAFDRLLDGGFDNDILTTIYGPAGSGKTTIGMLAAICQAKENRKTIFIDTEGGFSTERFMQIADRDLLKKILILKPLNFGEQMKTILNLTKNFPDNVGLLIIDTISMLYRTEASSRNVKEVNNELGLQISWLVEIARTKKIPVVAINQVYADFDKKDAVKMVGGDILKYSSKCLIELLNLNNKKKALLKKHRSIPEKSIDFKIVASGFEET